MLCSPTTQYFHRRDGLDFRSLRYPGIISTEALGGGGTTDWSLDIFYDALRTGKYECFLSPDTQLPMLFMSDCVRATLGLLEAKREDLSTCTYNVTGVSYTPAQMAAAIRKQIPGFEISYKPGDFRQAIADSWPRSLDDAVARADWAWEPQVDTVDAFAERMLARLRVKLTAMGETLVI